MNKLKIYLNQNTGFSFSNENIDFIEDIFNGHGYLLFVKDDILYRINEFEDLPAWQQEDLERKLGNLPNPYM